MSDILVFFILWSIKKHRMRILNYSLRRENFYSETLSWSKNSNLVSTCCFIHPISNWNPVIFRYSGDFSSVLLKMWPEMTKFFSIFPNAAQKPPLFYSLIIEQIIYYKNYLELLKILDKVENYIYYFYHFHQKSFSIIFTYSAIFFLRQPERKVFKSKIVTKLCEDLFGIIAIKLHY
jgi:hypothetical protein